MRNPCSAPRGNLGARARTSFLFAFLMAFALVGASTMTALAHNGLDAQSHVSNSGGNGNGNGKGGNSVNAPGPNKNGNGQRDNDGDADSNPGTSFTEDDDTNDGGTRNNVEDDGDNQHPSGKDRSVEHGKSGNQGKAESDPDDDGRGPDRTNRGPDKPNGSGGGDLADQDGNNGCGNDDDFEDDNEGRCLGRQGPKDPPPSPQCDADPNMPGVQPCGDSPPPPPPAPQCDGNLNLPGIQPCDEVGGGIIQRPTLPDVVLGTRIFNRDDDPSSVLPFTGGNPAPWLSIVALLISAGTGLVLVSRRKKADAK